MLQKQKQRGSKGELDASLDRRDTLGFAGLSWTQLDKAGLLVSSFCSLTEASLHLVKIGTLYRPVQNDLRNFSRRRRRCRGVRSRLGSPLRRRSACPLLVERSFRARFKRLRPSSFSVAKKKQPSSVQQPSSSTSALFRSSTSLHSYSKALVVPFSRLYTCIQHLLARASAKVMRSSLTAVRRARCAPPSALWFQTARALWQRQQGVCRMVLPVALRQIKLYWCSRELKLLSPPARVASPEQLVCSFLRTLRDFSQQQRLGSTSLDLLHL